MRPDGEIKRDVEAELASDADVEVTGLSVEVSNGVVTLSGHVPSIFQKHQAARAARFVTGVTAIANDVVVRSQQASRKTDPEIAHEIIARLRFWLPEAWQRITPSVQNGHVMLDGTVEWHEERDLAESIARGVRGVASVGNLLHVAPSVSTDDVRLRIEEAFRSSAEIDASRVAVNADGSEVTLRGRVRSWSEREQAQRCAWSTPGVTKVTNNLRVKA